MRTVTIEVSSLRKSLARAKRAWNTREPQGEFISFDSLEALLRTLTVKRWELIQKLQDIGPVSIRALARRLGRDVKNVHGDVTALVEIGLVERTGQRVSVPYEEIRAGFAVRKAA